MNAAALQCLALGLTLARAPRRAWLPSAIALPASMFVRLPEAWREGMMLGCWMTVIATAASVYLISGPGFFGAVALSLLAGVSVELVGSPIDLLWLGIVWPAAWVARQRASVALSVVASWVIAVAALALALHLLPVTLGDMPDHME